MTSGLTSGDSFFRYGGHRGLPALRELIAADAGRPLSPDATGG